MLEIVNLIVIGIASFNFKTNVASDIGKKYRPPENINSQRYIRSIEAWTHEKQMKLNIEKSKYMNINFSKNHKVNSRLYMENKLLQQVKETRLLGVILRDDLSFKSNTEQITRNSYKRMVILHKLGKFSLPIR